MRRINLQYAVSIAEIVSALAVVVTLLYMASEFRRSRTLTSTDVETLLYDRMLEMDRLQIEADGLADVLARAVEGSESLTSVDSARFLAHEHVFYDSWELAWAAHQDGILEESTWVDWDSWFALEAGRRPEFGWEGNKRNYGQDFVQYVDQRAQRK
jgi:hypothetical protein